MEFEAGPNQDGNRRRFWVKNAAVALLIGGWYVSYVQCTIDTLAADVASLNARLSDIVDARQDTLHQLTEIKNLARSLEQSLSNQRKTIQDLIDNEIEKIYSDRTGRTDFALESAGGRIVQLTAGTENYEKPKNFAGISLCEGMHGPRAMIQSNMNIGNCWAFKGSNGGAIIKLLGPIKVDAVSLEHISKSLSPVGDVTTAPKDFSVWGLRSPTDRGTLLGQFVYKIDGPLVQTFPIHSEEVFDFVELKVISNHGSFDFTCIYRFRVHGVMDMTRDK